MKNGDANNGAGGNNAAINAFGYEVPGQNN